MATLLLPHQCTAKRTAGLSLTPPDHFRFSFRGEKLMVAMFENLQHPTQFTTWSWLTLLCIFSHFPLEPDSPSIYLDSSHFPEYTKCSGHTCLCICFSLLECHPPPSYITKAIHSYRPSLILRSPEMPLQLWSGSVVPSEVQERLVLASSLVLPYKFLFLLLNTLHCPTRHFQV